MVTKGTRTEYAVKNVIIGSITQIIAILLAFVGRTVFIKLLNADYLGVNGLYTNILSVLSFTELGFGSAIIFSLYKPIAEKDKSKIQALMKLYAKVYRIIGITIFIVGLALIPFLSYIVKDTPDIKENLVVIYILFLIDTSVSYLFNYKKTLITANQKDYIVQIYNRAFQFIQIIGQSIFLLITHKYLIYLTFQVCCTVLRNVILSRKAEKMYPLLKEKNDNTLNKQEVTDIFANVKGLAVHRFCSVILNSTDNIIISAIISITTVGIASNYNMVINYITGIIGQAILGMTASIGNLSAVANKKKIKQVMHQLLLLTVWLYGLIAIGCMVLMNEFINLWIGPDYLLSPSVVFSLVFSVYINGVQFSAYTLRTTQGIFIEGCWVPLVAAFMNIVLSLWWGKVFGVAGIFVATGVSRLLTTTLVDPWLVYKNNSMGKPFDYYAKYFVETLAVILNAAVQMCLIHMIYIEGLFGFIFKFIVICVSTNLVFILEFWWMKDFKELVRRFKYIVIKILKRNVL